MKDVHPGQINAAGRASLSPDRTDRTATRPRTGRASHPSLFLDSGDPSVATAQVQAERPQRSEDGLEGPAATATSHAMVVRGVLEKIHLDIRSPNTLRDFR